MNLKQGQEVRDAADPNRIGIVVNIVLGDTRVFWQDTEQTTWTSARPVVVPRTRDETLGRYRHSRFNAGLDGVRGLW